MADDFSFTDSDDDRAVQDVLQQAMDHSLLEQLAAINCSSFSTTDNLPSHLETRFRKLKSLPTTASAVASRFPPSKSRSLRPRSGDDFNFDERNPGFSGSAEFQRKLDENKDSESNPSIDSSEEQFDRNRNERKRLESKSESKSKSSLKSPPSIDSPEEQSDRNRNERKLLESKSNSKLNSNPEARVYKQKDLNSNPEARVYRQKDLNSNPEARVYKQKDLNSNPEARVYKQKDSKSKSRTGSSKSRSNSWSLSSPESESDTGTPSPPRRKIGCLWCSPKKEKKSVPRKQGKENRHSSSSLSSLSSSWGNHDVEFLKTFSIKEQKKIMKKAMKEEEKITREAEKIVKWAKQASSRMLEVSGGVDDDDEVSDIENIK